MKERLKRISIDDNITFKYNTDVINACFRGDHAEDKWLQIATKETGDGCRAWFPKEARIKSGRVEPGSSEVNWKNQFEKNGEIIVSWLYDGEMTKDNGKAPTVTENPDPLYCFWQNMEESNPVYRYVGTYLMDYYASKPRRIVYRRLRTEIDLTRWYDPEAYDHREYWQKDFQEKGNDVYRDYYIDKDYEKQKRMVNAFFRHIDKVNKKEAALEECRIKFLKSIRIKDCQDEESRRAVFLPTIAGFVNAVLPIRVSLSDLWPDGIDDQILTQFYFDILSFNAQEHKHIDLLRECPVDPMICGCLLFAISPELFLFCLSQRETEYYLEKLGIKYELTDDLVEKQLLLYFWKQCNRLHFSDSSLSDVECDSPHISGYSAFSFFEFLKSAFGTISKDRIYQIDSNSLEQGVMEDERQNRELYQKSRVELPQAFEYKRRIVEKPNVAGQKASKSIPRDPKKKINALVKAGFSCEMNPEHESFISRSTDMPYMETHHLVPLEFWEEFEGYLDTEENIVCLCSNCHNEIHYGKNPEHLIQKLYSERKQLLKEAGIDISLDDLLKLYNRKE